MIRQIKMEYEKDPIPHDDCVSENTIRRACDLFFKTKHGKRETFNFYKGFVIVRNTVEFTGCQPKRKTTLYIFFPKYGEAADLFYVSCPDSLSIQQTKRKIDKILEEEKF